VQQERHEQAPNAAVAVTEGVYCFELVVNQGETHEGRHLVAVGVHASLEGSKAITESLRRRWHEPGFANVSGAADEILNGAKFARRLVAAPNSLHQNVMQLLDWDRSADYAVF
jgi:hypothetical protein